MQTGPEALRQEIRRAELAVAALRPGADRERAVALLHCLDRIDEAAEQLGQRGIDLRAERARIETIHNQTLQKSGAIVQAVGREWEALRAEVEATRPRWWWYLDERKVAARAQRRRRRGWIAGAVLLLAGVAAALYLLVLRPDETVRRRVALVAQAERLVEAGAHAEALEVYRQAAEVAPGEAEIYVAIGALHEAEGEVEAAEEAYGRAEALYGDAARYWAGRSGRYLLLGWWRQGAAAAQAAVDVDPELALAYCHLGSAYEAQGQMEAAIEAVRACREKARAQGQDELYVLATSRLGLLLRAPGRGRSRLKPPLRTGEGRER
jgi:tetratricopeptide (TPR) repeat protein